MKKVPHLRNSQPGTLRIALVSVGQKYSPLAHIKWNIFTHIDNNLFPFYISQQDNPIPFVPERSKLNIKITKNECKQDVRLYS